MIDNKNLGDLFKKLDHELSKLNLFRELTIYGGASLIALKQIERATVDIDVFLPRIDNKLKEIIFKMAKEFQLNDLWINSTGYAFIKELPRDWENRTQIIYKGNYLIIKSLGRIDLIFTKILAELDRQEDLLDLEQLKPQKNELEFIKDDLIKLDDSKEWRSKVNEIFEYLVAVSYE